MSDLDDFIQAHAHELNSVKRSVLEPHKDEILQMKQLGFTEKLILKFLAEKKKITVSQQALNRFVRSRMGKLDKPCSVNRLTDNKVTVPEEKKQPVPLVKRQQSESGKFDWQKQIKPEEYI